MNQLKRSSAVIVLLVLAFLSPTPALAQLEPPPSNLLDYWLAWQSSDTGISPDWAYAYVEYQSAQSPDVEFQQQRLHAELNSLSSALSLSPQASLTAAVLDWQRTLHEFPPQRTPGRVDIAWLAAHPRYVPTLSELEHIGYCHTPDWIEIWSLGGVDRIAWHDDITSKEALGSLPGALVATQPSAVLVSPLGQTHRFGIAPWNHEVYSLAPGSRLWLDLTDDLIAGQTSVIRWLNQAMPEALATRLPSDECTLLWQSATTEPFKQ